MDDRTVRHGSLSISYPPHALTLLKGPDRVQTNLHESSPNTRFREDFGVNRPEKGEGFRAEPRESASDVNQRVSLTTVVSPDRTSIVLLSSPILMT
jgi:hypothetical protein